VKADHTRNLLRAAIAAVRDCAEKIEAQAESLLLALPGVPIDEKLGPVALEQCAGLKDTAGRVTFELALLQAEVGEGKAEAATAVRTLSGLDAAMMEALAAMSNLVDRLEVAAERDEKNEPAFVLVIEAAGVMLQALENAKVATQALRAALTGNGNRAELPEKSR
jgi:hypothetical protein